ncbi:MAG: hypothetical protein JO214_12075 [Frankiaceae bacterium]|nr:hypothetical protein [Frankiaceae bacterium]
MHDSLHRLYQAKLTILALLLFFVGLGLLIFGHWVESQAGWHWLHNWPIVDIGSGMFTTGLLGVGLQYLDSADSEVRDTERLKRVLSDSTPAMRDAVIDGFAFEPDDLARVATPEVLDRITANALSIRLSDESFAQEIVDDLTVQAINMPERLYDARISIRLSMDRGTAKGRAPMYVAVVRWEFRFTPVYPIRRFTCLSDPNEFRELNNDTAATSAWYIAKRTGLDAAAESSFQLVDFQIDGEPLKLQRSSKKGSQTYSVALGEEAMHAVEPLSVAYTYRTLVVPSWHVLQLRVDQPTKRLAVSIDYSDTDLKHVSVLDFIASGERTRISHSADFVPERTINVDFDGWVFPRSGLAFVWD